MGKKQFGVGVQYQFARITEQEIYRFGGEKRWFPKSCEVFQNDFYPDLSYNDLGYLEHLSFLAWHKRNYLLWASIPFLEKGIPRIGSGTCKRSNKKLRRSRLLYRWESRRKAGNIWLINPRLICSSKREELENYSLAERVFNSDQKDPKFLSDHFDPIFGSKRSESRKRSGTVSDQIDPEVLDLRSVRDGASRQRPFIPIGGVLGTPSEGQKRCPDGQDRKHQKGAAHSGGSIGSPQPYKAQLRELGKALSSGMISPAVYQAKVEALATQYEEQTFFVNSESDEGPEKASVEGDRSTFHAQPDA